MNTHYKQNTSIQSIAAQHSFSVPQQHFIVKSVFASRSLSTRIESSCFIWFSETDVRIILNIFLTYSQRTISSLYERTHHEEKPHTLHSIVHSFGSCCIDVRARSAGYDPNVLNSGLSEKPRVSIYPKSTGELCDVRRLDSKRCIFPNG